MAIIAIGIDLAKNIFAVHGFNVWGTVLLREPKVARVKLGALIAALPPSSARTRCSSCSIRV